MDNKRKFRITAACIAVLCVVFLGMLVNAARPMAKPAEEPGESKLEFYQQREEAINAFAAVLERFAVAHPEAVIVQNRTANSLEYLSARIQRSDMPDLFTHWPTQLSFQSATSAGKVVSLADQEFLNRVNPGALELCREEDGAVYALPVNRNCMEVYYNADLFESLGLSEPGTLEEFLSLCETLKAAGMQPLTLYPRDNRTAHMAQTMMAALNGDYLTLLGELADGTIADADRAALMDTLRLMRTLYADYSDMNAGRTYYEACENFARGESAMIVTGSYALSLLRGMEPEFEMDVFPFPGRDGGRRAILTSIDTALCVSSDCADRELALHFLEFLTRDEIIAEYVARDGAPSCIQGVYHDDPITRKMQSHLSEYENVEWIKSRYSLESCLAFESAICSYLISGDEAALVQGLTEAFAAKAS